MWATLGEIQFSTETGPDELTRDTGTQYAQHNYIQGKPFPEMTGYELDAIKMKLMMHYLSGNQTPEARIKELQLARVNGDVMPLVFENGVYYGDFVITKISEDHKRTDPTGYIVYAEVDVELLEYVEPDGQDVKARAAVNYAYANKGDIGLIQPAPIVLNTAQQAANLTLQSTQGISDLRKKANKLNATNINNFRRDLQRTINKVADAARHAQTIVTAAQNLPNSGNLAVALQNIWQGADAFHQTIPLASVADIMTGTKVLSDLSGTCKAALAPITQVIGLRKPI